MHLHASASEGVGSVRSQLAQAAAQRLRRRLVHRPRLAPAPAAVPPDLLLHAPTSRSSAARGPCRRWPTSDRSPPAAAASWSTTPVSPNDPAARKGSLRLRATSSGTGAARCGTGSTPRAARGPTSGAGSPAAPSRSTSCRRKSGPRRVGRGVPPAVPPPGRRWPAGRRPHRALPAAHRHHDPDHQRAGLTGVVDVPVTRGRWQTVTPGPDHGRRGDLARRRPAGQLAQRDRVPRGLPPPGRRRVLLRLPALRGDGAATTPSASRTS